MTLSERITEALKEAMKNKDEARKRTIRAIKSQILLMQTDGSGQEITSDRELKMLQTMAKQREESLETYIQQGREDLAAIEREEIEIIKEFLPKQLDDAALTTILKEIIAEVGASSPKDMGKVMGELKKLHPDNLDFAIASPLLKELLNK